MPAIPPKTNIDGLQQCAADLIEGAFSRGVKYGRYLEQQEQKRRKEETEAKKLKTEYYCNEDGWR